MYQLLTLAEVTVQSYGKFTVIKGILKGKKTQSCSDLNSDTFKIRFSCTLKKELANFSVWLVVFFVENELRRQG